MVPVFRILPTILASSGLVFLVIFFSPRPLTVVQAQSYTGICTTSADLDALEPGQWCRSNSNTIYDVRPNPLPANGFGGFYSTNANITAWSSGAYDTARDRLVVLGGGHADYSGNELYAFSLATMNWSRIWGPTPNAQIVSSVETYLDGNPSSRHTYDGVEYLPTQDALWLQGGSIFGSGDAGQDDWMFSFATSTWTEKAVPLSYVPLGITSGYDSVTGDMFVTPGYGLYRFNPVTNAWSTPNPDNPIPGSQTGVLDPVRRKLILVGNGLVYSYNLTTGARQTLTTTGDTAIVNTRYAGLEYDPTTDRVVAWGGYGDTGEYVLDVYSLNLDTLVWTKQVPAQTNLTAPGTPGGTGTFGRWRYIPSKNVFIVVNAVNQPVYFYKFSDGDGVPPADTTAPTISNIQSTPTSSGATIIWTTNEASDSQIEYGLTGSYGSSTTLNTSDVTSHSVAITGLSPSTLYHFRVKSRDPSDNLATSTDATFTTPATSSPPGQLNIPLDTWVAVPSPTVGQGACPGGICKHMRLAFNSDNNRIYFLGGDYESGGGHAQSGNNSMWSYSIADNDWNLETPYCLSAGATQPSHPDEVGFAYDSQRNAFWMYPGFQYDGDTCSSTEVYQKPMKYSVATDVWSDPNLPWDAFNVRFSQYDPVGDRTLSFEYAGDTIIEHNLATNVVTRRTTVIPQGEDGGSAFVTAAYSAFDPVGRKIYAIDPVRGKLYRYDLVTNEFKFLTTNPVIPCIPGSYCSPEQPIFWDTTNSVLLWPYRSPTIDSGYPDEPIRLFVYDPEENDWTERSIGAPQNLQGNPVVDGNGDPYRVIGRNGIYDPVQNVMMIMGTGADVGAVPYIFLYRYSDGSGAPPPPPDTLAPAAVSNLLAQ